MADNIEKIVEQLRAEESRVRAELDDALSREQASKTKLRRIQKGIANLIRDDAGTTAKPAAKKAAPKKAAKKKPAGKKKPAAKKKPAKKPAKRR